MIVSVTTVDRHPKLGFKVKPGHNLVTLSILWNYAGSGSSSPLAGQLYVIGSDNIVVNQTQDTSGSVPTCASFDTPELNSGGKFGPKTICFDMAVSPDGPLTMRWKHGILGGHDQDLLLS